MDYYSKEEIASCSSVCHGGRLKRTHPQLMDFSVSLNPYPLPAAVQEAVNTCDLVNYPDSDAEDLKEEISGCFGAKTEELLVTNGVSQAIFLITMCFLERGDDVIIQEPAYGEYEKNSRLFSAHIHHIRATPDTDFTFDVERMLTMISRIHPKLVWICNPNNPTGGAVAVDQLTEIADRCAEYRTLLIVDEAYIHFLQTPEDYEFHHPQTIIMRSMTKDFSLAGLRIAYLQAEKSLIDQIRKIQPEWSMNAPALAAASAALEHMDIFTDQWKRIRKDTLYMEQRLRHLGHRCFTPMANFILSGYRTSSEGNIIDHKIIHQRLLAYDIAVRDCTSFGLSDYMRIGTRTPAENERLLSILQKEELWQL